MTQANKRKTIIQERRRRRVRAKIFGTGERPRLSVHKSNQHVYAQIIDDEKSITIAASSDTALSPKKNTTLKERAKLVGADVAKKAKAKNIHKVVYDRGGLSYAGAVQALAESARKEGLIF